MPHTELKNDLDESDVLDLFLEKKVVSEAQLKAALDFKKSIGGSVVDVLYKLGLIRSTNIEEIVREAEDVTDERHEDTKESNAVLDPASINMEELKLHHRLLDKLPPAMVDQFLLLLFFPVSQVCSRKLIVGHGKDIDDQVLSKVRGLLGVEICSLAVSEQIACDYLTQYDERSGGGKPQRVPSTAVATPVAPPSASRAASPAASPVSREQPTATSPAALPGKGGRTDEQALLKALIGLLIKKGLITKAELQLEFELPHRR